VPQVRNQRDCFGVSSLGGLGFSAGRGGVAAWLQWLTASRLRAAIALVALCLVTYAPGVIRLPAVDRTEIVYADSARQMVASGDWLDPRYGDVVHAFRPPGTYWLQSAVLAVTGADTVAQSHNPISWHRLPGLLAVTSAVFAIYWLAAPMVGAGVAFIAAALFAVAPLTVLVAQLAIAEGLSLFPAVVAMLALARIYVRETEVAPATLVYAFWMALGFAVLINALMVPILVLATIIALFSFDRSLGWLKPLFSPLPILLAMVIAAPWLIVRAQQDGVPFSGLTGWEFITALGGSQDMKLRAFPGTFVLAALLGFLPGTALLAAAMLRLWGQRFENRLARFLLAWTLGYLIYLEALSSKPGTYMVQVMFPAFALAVAMLIAAWQGEERRTPPAWHGFVWPPLAALFALVLLCGGYVAFNVVPNPLAIGLIAGVAALFFVSAQSGRAGDLPKWWAQGVAALSLFAVTLLSVVLPSLNGLWPARDIKQAIVARCGDQTITAGLLGFREPSGAFVLHAEKSLQMPEAIAAENPPLRIIENRWIERYSAAVSSPGTDLGCVRTFNAMRGCALTFTIFAGDGNTACKAIADPACTADVPQGGLAKDCD
jgi:4-amino-4-deoxy-L-arabinose transferase-like glycosyltransferase